MERPITQSTNPYIRQQTGQSTPSNGRESSANAWEESPERPPQPLDTPPPPPVPKGENFSAFKGRIFDNSYTLQNQTKY
jgi:hypothetical protein